MLGCIQPMSSPMMKRMFGLLACAWPCVWAGACAWAKDGELSAGTINAVKAPETSMPVAVRLFVVMTPGPPIFNQVLVGVVLVMPEGCFRDDLK
jgi:hypothetical protein